MKLERKLYFMLKRYDEIQNLPDELFWNPKITAERRKLIKNINEVARELHLIVE